MTNGEVPWGAAVSVEFFCYDDDVDESMLVGARVVFPGAGGCGGWRAGGGGGCFCAGCG